jgi:hypothetical protein
LVNEHPPFRFWATKAHQTLDARISRNINKVGTEQRGAALVGMNKRKLGRLVNADVVGQRIAPAR